MFVSYPQISRNIMGYKYIANVPPNAGNLLQTFEGTFKRERNQSYRQMINALTCRVAESAH